MTNRIFGRLEQVDSRIVSGVMVLLIGLALLEAWMLLLRLPYRELRSIQITHATLAASLSQSPDQGCLLYTSPSPRD
jgi:hypothetical protein